MNIFKLFKTEDKGKSMLQPMATESKEHESTLIWNRFWGQYDAVMEMACLRKSINLKAEHVETIEKMFIDSLMDLEEAAANLVADYRKAKEPDGS